MNQENIFRMRNIIKTLNKDIERLDEKLNNNIKNIKEGRVNKVDLEFQISKIEKIENMLERENADIGKQRKQYENKITQIKESIVNELMKEVE